MKKKKSNNIPLYLPGLMKPLEVPVESLSDDIKKQISAPAKKGKTVADKISNGKFVIKVGSNGM